MKEKILWALLKIISVALATDNVVIHVEKAIEDCEVTCKMWDYASVYLVGWREDVMEIESTFAVNKPMEIQVGAGMVMKGVEDALIGMCVGERRRLTIPYPYTLNRRGELNSLLAVGEVATYSVELWSLSDRPTINSFNWFDSNGDVKIDENEAREIMKLTLSNVQQYPSFNVNLAAALYILMYDEDADGFISEEEYLRAVSGSENALQESNAKSNETSGKATSLNKIKAKLNPKKSRSYLLPMEENLKYLKYIDDDRSAWIKAEDFLITKNRKEFGENSFSSSDSDISYQMQKMEL